MPLYDVESATGRLEAITATGTAISEPVSKLIVEEDYRRVSHIRYKGKTGNFFENDTVPDKLLEIGQSGFQDGDVYWVASEAGKYYKVTIDSNTQTFETVLNYPLTGNWRSTGAPSYIILSHSETGINWNDMGSLYRLFTSSDNTSDSLIFTENDAWVGWEFEEPVKVTRLRCHASSYNIYLEGSNDGGATWTDLGCNLISVYNAWKDVGTPDYYKQYRLRAGNVSSTSNRLYYLRLEGSVQGLDMTGFEGWTPGDFARVQMKPEILPDVYLNGYIRTPTEIRPEVDSRGSYFALCEDLTIFPARSITTRVDFKAAGDTIDEIFAVLYDVELKSQPAMTSNSAPTNTVYFEGVDAPAAESAYRIFRDQVVEDGYSVPVPNSGIVDFSHVYQFSQPTFVYKFEMTTGPANEAPRAYLVQGSHDGLAWDTLVDATQEISVEDLTLLKRWDPTAYQKYTYYRINVTAGTPDGLVSAKRYKLIIEDTELDHEVPEIPVE